MASAYLTKMPHYCESGFHSLRNLIDGKFEILSHCIHQSPEVVRSNQVFKTFAVLLVEGGVELLDHIG
uniref:Uncharacterized protein n=1 Tax=Oryza rufipogon TaxID=4529 RepID=A0A0E0P495_ORYRU